MRWRVCFYIFLFNFGFTYSLLKDVGEVTNYSLYIESLLKAPKRTKLLIGGIPTGTRHLPHNILFLNYLGVCGGVIISNTIVLTCAHCLDSNKNRPDMKVFAGARYLFDKKADVYDVWDFVIHGDYDRPVRFSNDAALLIIRGQFKYKPSVQKAQLVNHRDWMKEGNIFRVSGWEQSSVSENRTAKGLQSVDLSFVPYSKCRELTDSTMSPDMFCLFGDGKRGPCRGDSGGAAMLDKYVVGLASHNVRCEELPGIYTNVYYLRPWIEAASLKLYHEYCRYHYKSPTDY